MTLTSHFSVAIARFFCIAKDEKHPSMVGFIHLWYGVHTPNFWLICYTRILTIVGSGILETFTCAIRRGDLYSHGFSVKTNSPKLLNINAWKMKFIQFWGSGVSRPICQGQTSLFSFQGVRKVHRKGRLGHLWGVSPVRRFLVLDEADKLLDTNFRLGQFQLRAGLRHKKVEFTIWAFP